ncbi:TPA: hypothetical protein R9B53_004734 [Escherichia coli]|nr:hypothetical protein [Escherichia coli]
MNEFKLKKIKTVHLPKQKGPLKDYWVAIFEGQIEGAETKSEAIRKLLSKMKDLH